MYMYVLQQALHVHVGDVYKNGGELREVEP